MFLEISIRYLEIYILFTLPDQPVSGYIYLAQRHMFV